MEKEVQCFKCGSKIKVMDRVGRRDECASCRSDVHVCKNCEFYDPSSYNECRESSADVVQEKERANFCDYFSPGSNHSKSDDKEALMSAAEALFKKN